MAIPTDHPFQPGVRVAVRQGDGRDRSYKEAVVDRVYATGHFILRSEAPQASPKRWRPWKVDGTWSASETARDRWFRRDVILWDANEAEITKGIDRQERHKRFQRVCGRIADIGPEKISDALLDALEAALAEAAKPKEEEAS